MSDAFYTESYDYVHIYKTRRDVQFYVDIAQRSDGAVLEIGCGTGRVLIPTARVGREIVGLDPSAERLAVCREKLSREPEPVQQKVMGLVQGDMRDFDLSERFGLVTMPFQPFMYMITTEDQLACLECIRRHLLPQGLLAFDVFTPSIKYLCDEKYSSEFNEEPEVTLPDGRRVIRRTRIASHDLLTQKMDFEMIYYVTYPDGHQERLVNPVPQRYLWRDEAEHLLARCGLMMEEAYCDFDKTPFSLRPKSDLVIVARKR